MVQLDEFSEFNFCDFCNMWNFPGCFFFFFFWGGGGQFSFCGKFWMVICKDWLDFFTPPKSEKGPLERCFF